VHGARSYKWEISFGAGAAVIGVSDTASSEMTTYLSPVQFNLLCNNDINIGKTGLQQ
jgi:hypothetical protein